MFCVLSWLITNIIHEIFLFIGAFRKSYEKSTICPVMSVCLPVGLFIRPSAWNIWAPSGKDFHENLYLRRENQNTFYVQ